MQQLSKQIKELAVSCNVKSEDLTWGVTRLDAIQGSIARLMEEIDAIQFKGWDKDVTTAFLSIRDIERKVRLINMAFHPLYKELSGGIEELHIKCTELNKIVCSELLLNNFNKENTGLDINSLEGWNYFTMENNIKTFIKEVGREPESFEEVSLYITETVAKVVANHENNKKADVLTSANEI